MRRADDIDRNAYMGTELKGKTLGIIGIGHVGGRLANCARPCSACGSWPSIPI
jgi:phosphoglycerate dehydrogenase-like enzyme